MITEPTPIDSVKTVICPKCQHSYYVDLHMSLKERVICAFCKQEVNMAYQEPAKLCSCNGASRQDEGQYVETIKSVGLLYVRRNQGNKRIRVELSTSVRDILKMRDNYRSVTIYINPMPVPRENRYPASCVNIAEIDDNLKTYNEKVK